MIGQVETQATTLTDREQGIDREATEKARAAARKRGKQAPRGQGHPATSEMDYTAEELEFFAAIGEYKNRTGRQFPTWGEVLRVVKSLGYDKDDTAVILLPEAITE